MKISVPSDTLCAWRIVSAIAYDLPRDQVILVGRILFSASNLWLATKWCASERIPSTEAQRKVVAYLKQQGSDTVLAALMDAKDHPPPVEDDSWIDF